MQATLYDGSDEVLFDGTEKTATVLGTDGEVLEIMVHTADGNRLLHLSRRECEFDIDALRTELKQRRLERREPQTKFSAEKFTRRLMQLEQETAE